MSRKSASCFAFRGSSFKAMTILARVGPPLVPTNHHQSNRSSEFNGLAIVESTAIYVRTLGLGYCGHVITEDIDSQGRLHSRMSLFEHPWTEVLEYCKLVPTRILEQVAGPVRNLELATLRLPPLTFQLLSCRINILDFEDRQTRWRGPMPRQKKQGAVTYPDGSDSCP